MTKRLQIPISRSDEALVKSAARKNGITTAEWARRLLLEKAKESLGEAPRSAEDVLKELFSLEAPIDTVNEMMRQSTKGRLY